VAPARPQPSRVRSLIGISPGTLRNWEQGRRVPEGPAKVLLRVTQRHPEAFDGRLGEQHKPFESSFHCERQHLRVNMAIAATLVRAFALRIPDPFDDTTHEIPHVTRCGPNVVGVAGIASHPVKHLHRPSGLL
jgi:hypothetical protein